MKTNLSILFYISKTNNTNRLMKLEGVIVCVNYSDFLAHSIVHNRNLFDKLVVVTDTKDKQTKKICNHYNVECVETDVFYENGDTFNKGKGINAGLDRLSKDGWVIHMDADIVLPPLTRGILQRLERFMDKQGIYSVDRFMVPSFEAWMNYMSQPHLTHEAWIFTHMHVFPLGQRISEYMSNGYEPIGYFQMWNAKETGIHKYPDQHGEADRTDVLFAKMFDRSHRHLLPEIVCFHLDSADQHGQNKMGANWKGRKTPYFGLAEEVVDVVVKIEGGYELTCYERLVQKVKAWLVKWKLMEDC